MHGLLAGVGLTLRRAPRLLALASRRRSLLFPRPCGRARHGFRARRPSRGGPLGLLLLPLHERPPVILDAIAVEGPHTGRQLPQECTVVAHQDDRAFVLLETVLERFDGLHI